MAQGKSAGVGSRQKRTCMTEGPTGCPILGNARGHGKGANEVRCAQARIGVEGGGGWTRGGGGSEGQGGGGGGVDPPPCQLLLERIQHRKITSQRLLDQSHAGVYRGKRHIPPLLGLFGAIHVPYPKGLNRLFNPL